MVRQLEFAVRGAGLLEIAREVGAVGAGAGPDDPQPAAAAAAAAWRFRW